MCAPMCWYVYYGGEWMSISDTALYRQDLNEYMKAYFGTEDWLSSATTQSGIDSMIVDLEMMARGLSTNLNYVTEIERDLTASGVLEPATNTKYLSDFVQDWAMTENTTYAEVVRAEIIRLLVKREPVLQLRNWFGLDMEQCEVLWKTINIFAQNKNLQDSYGQATELRRIELQELTDINLEGEDI